MYRLKIYSRVNVKEEVDAGRRKRTFEIWKNIVKHRDLLQPDPKHD